MKKQLYEVDCYSNIIGKKTIDSMEHEIVFFHKEKTYRIYPTESEDENAPYIDMFMVAGKKPLAVCCFCKNRNHKQTVQVSKLINNYNFHRIISERWGFYLHTGPYGVDEMISLLSYYETENRLRIPCYPTDTYQDLVGDFNIIRRGYEAAIQDQL